MTNFNTFLSTPTVDITNDAGTVVDAGIPRHSTQILRNTFEDCHISHESNFLKVEGFTDVTIKGNTFKDLFPSQDMNPKFLTMYKGAILLNLPSFLGGLPSIATSFDNPISIIRALRLSITENTFDNIVILKASSGFTPTSGLIYLEKCV